MSAATSSVGKIDDDSSGASPVMVCGVPRTGVRLVASLLDAQPGFASGPELPFILTMAQQWRDIEHTLGSNHERHYGLAPAHVRKAFAASIMALVTPRLSSCGKQQFVFQSFGMLLLLETFAELFPRARFLLCVRDPRDVVCSLLTCGWRNPRDGSPLPYTVDFRMAARYASEFMQAAAAQVAALTAAGRMRVVRYEELCLDSSKSLPALAEFLQMAVPTPQIAAASAALLTSSAAPDSAATLQAGALRADRVGRWRRELRPEQLAVIQPLLAPWRAFGYS